MSALERRSHSCDRVPAIYVRVSTREQTPIYIGKILQLAVIQKLTKTSKNRDAICEKKAGIHRILFTQHTLRHTACSLIRYRKIPVEIVHKVVDHVDITTTMIYFHIVSNIVVGSFYKAFWEGLI